MADSNENNNGAAAVMELPVAEVRPAAANVHGKEKRGDTTFRGLVESIKANGLIHRIVVRRDSADGGWVVVDGHRRLAAAKAAGLKSVPVEVRDVDADKALAVTIAANVQRLVNDPLLEAEAIERMLASGMERREIAASIGKDEAYVARRARLISLAKPWREFARRVPCTTDLLERVAAHDKALQERVAERLDIAHGYEYNTDGDERCPWGEFASTFERETMRIAAAKFDTSDCRSCPNNTACHPYLFDFMRDEEGEADARCQDSACFVRRSNERVDAIVEELRRKGTPAVEVADRWRVPDCWNAKDARDKAHAQAYVYRDGDIKVLVWSVPRQKADSGMTAEERQAERARKLRARLVRSARDKVREVAADGGAMRLFNGSEAGGMAFKRIAAMRLARDLDGSWLSDSLIDDIMGEFAHGIREQVDITDEEADAYATMIDEREEAAAEDSGTDGDGPEDGGE